MILDLVNLAANDGKHKVEDKKHKHEKKAKKDKKKHHHVKGRLETTNKSLADSSVFMQSQLSEYESRRSSPPKTRHSDQKQLKREITEKPNSKETTLTQT